MEIEKFGFPQFRKPGSPGGFIPLLETRPLHSYDPTIAASNMRLIFRSIVNDITGFFPKSIGYIQVHLIRNGWGTMAAAETVLRLRSNFCHELMPHP